MDMFEKEYHTRRNGGSVNLSHEAAKRVIGELKRHYDEGSIPSGNGRIYFVEGGTIEHSMGPQPELKIKSPVGAGIEAIAKKFDLPL